MPTSIGVNRPPVGEGVPIRSGEEDSMATEPEPLSSSSTLQRPIIGLIEAEVPWTAPSPRVGKLLSAGVVARNVQRALSLVAQLEHYTPPGEGAPEEREATLAAF